MGYFFKTIPPNIALMLKDKYSLSVFIESGTYIGRSAEWASRHFSQVYTVEWDEEYFHMAENNLLGLRNVHMYLNDSRNALPNILEEVGRRSALLYSDSHWSETAHYSRPIIDSVVMDEILIINQWDNDNHVIVVDDAHKLSTAGWPIKEGVIKALENKGQRSVKERLDVLIATPIYRLERLKLKRSFIDVGLHVTYPEVVQV